MSDYKISSAIARQIAVGLYLDISAFIKAADPEDYERFKAAYIEKQTAQKPAPAKRSYTRKSRAISR